MDCLTFGCPILLRGFTNKDEPVTEIKLDVALKELEMSMEEFIDLCILCGCDYCDSIEGIGPTKAFKYIKEEKNIEGVLKFCEDYNKDPKKKKKYICPEENFDFNQARSLFKEPEVIDPENVTLKWTTPNFEALKEFLCKEKGFNEGRIESAIKRIEVILIDLIEILKKQLRISYNSFLLKKLIFIISVCKIESQSTEIG